ncbi:enoyl-CoA hydratase-related protein [Novosphingobium resinovorum]|uniref:enoyl-CoA hydratase-related protein n=1 Tax=Novosphingobium resinovorum TaxID=158500 RepID=UPI002ED0F5C3|nr:enoyl-CoA hydratase-related protein [Novosphingobium resinovorum]
MPEQPLVELEIAGKVAQVRFNRPQALNALNFAMIDAMAAALDEAERQARVLVLSGNGRAFCSGADLSGGFACPAECDEEQDCGAPLETHLNPLMARLRALHIPWISAVHGAAAGGGAALGLAGDMVLATEDAQFVMAFARIGLVPDSGIFHMLVRTIGRVRANEMMLLGGRFGGEQALEWGLVNRVVPGERLMAEALELAQRIAEGPASLATIRKLSWSALDEDFAAMLRVEREAQRDSGRTQDFREGVCAFLEKRPPRFTGA